MFLSGDEFLNTQFGNNNAYCQDNEISWLDWSYADTNRENLEFFKFMIKFRKEHNVIRKKSGYCSLGFPEMSIFEPNESCRVLGVLFAGRTPEDDRDDIVYLALNVFWEDQTVTLPRLMSSCRWHLAVNTGEQELDKIIADTGDGQYPINGDSFRMAARSVCIFTAI